MGGMKTTWYRVVCTCTGGMEKPRVSRVPGEGAAEAPGVRQVLNLRWGVSQAGPAQARGGTDAISGRSDCV